MKILFASSEVQPLIKTGGLADVSKSLPRTLRNQRHDVRLVLPAYRGIAEKLTRCKPATEFTVFGSDEKISLLEGRLPGTHVTVYLIDAPAFFDRPGGPYSGEDGLDWPDNALRFGLFARAVCELAGDRAGLDWRPDVVHCNDWQCGLIPPLLSLEAQRPATIFTIHNLAYQGIFSRQAFDELALPKHWWSMHQLEFHGHLSFMKGGLVFADRVNTVSPTYAREIRTPEYGYGLEGLLQSRKDRLSGILNGIDYQEWNPSTDAHLPADYSRRYMAGKAKTKHALQREMGLKTSERTPLFAHIGRLVEQKGVDLILDGLDQLMQRPIQLVVLGSGQAHFEKALNQAKQRYPGRLGAMVGFNEGLAHRIEAAADVFLMPSRFEPCGLNQLYSLRYGTLPIVRRTGGLADSVCDITEASLADQTGTGFVFDQPDLPSLLAAVDRALTLYADEKAWRKVRTRAMSQDFSWKRSAAGYLDLYEKALADIE